MTTVRVILTAEEVSEAIILFAHQKTGRVGDTHTGKCETMVVFGQLPDGSTYIEQARVEMHPQ